MKGRVFSVMLAVCLISCGGPEIIGEAQRGNGTEGEGDFGETSGNGGNTAPAALYITGVEYPESYSWNPDLGCEAEGAILFLMKNGERIIELPIAYGNCISADADMHRCIDGHLYTDFSTENETVIKKDGQELCRYPGREMIVSLIERAEGLHTLGKPRSGTDWTYRINGEIIMRKNSGRLLGGLYMDNGQVCFAYEDLLKGSSSVKHRYYMVKDGTAENLPLTDDITQIDDVRCIDGKVCYIAQMKGLHARVLFRETEAKMLDLPSDFKHGVCHFLYGGDRLFVQGNMHRTDYSVSCYGFWEENRFDAGAGQISELLGSSASDEAYCFLTRQVLGEEKYLSLFNGEQYETIPLQYDFLFKDAICTYDGRCCVGLSDREKGSPALWLDGKLRAYNFNGCFTSVSFQ